MNIDNLTAANLLAIKVPEKLFTSPADAKKEYRKLSMRWHPDREGDDEVFKHVKALYEEAEKKIAAGSWKVPGVERVNTKDGRSFEIRYKKHHVFELGDMYVTDTVVAYMIKNEYSDLVESARKNISFKYATDKMKKDFSGYVPTIAVEAETDTHQMVVYRKTEDLLLLRDVIDHMKKVPARHAAWILSTLYNLNCFFKYNGLSHNAISPDTYFISPQFHSGAMLGGFWYASKIGTNMVAVPKRTLQHAPGDLIKDKKSTPMLDSYLIKATGLEMLGDIHGTKLIAEAKAGNIPQPLLNWLRTPGSEDPVDEYSTWKKKVLIDSFGPPKFHKLELTSKDLYE